MAHDVPRAVLVAHYTGRLSRMIVWETDRNVFQPGQWLRGGLELLDVSPDGRYAAYSATTRHRSVLTYIAVSRPPFLTALIFQPSAQVYFHTAFFAQNEVLEWTGAVLTPNYWRDDAEFGAPRVLPGCPLAIHQTQKPRRDERLDARERTRPGVREAIARFGPAAADLLQDSVHGLGLIPAADPILTPPPRTPGLPWSNPIRATWDHQGRLIVAHSPRLLAFSPDTGEMTELLDLSQTVFSTIPTPDWAKKW